MFEVQMLENKETKYYKKYYFVSYKDHCWDKEIAELLCINIREYQHLMMTFGADYIWSWYDVGFYNKNNAQNAVDYLNEKYGVMLKLEGG